MLKENNVITSMTPLTVEITNRQGQKKARVQDNKDSSYKIGYFAEETGKWDFSVKVNEDHVYGSPFGVKVKRRQFRPVLSFRQQGSTVGMRVCPWGVAVNECNEIAVTDNDNNRIQVFSSDGTFLKSFGRKGDKQGDFNFPAGIAFDKNGHIVVVDSDNHRVQVFSEQGEFLSQFGEQGSLDHQLQDPYGLSVDSDGNFIVADSTNKLMKIFFLVVSSCVKLAERVLSAFPVTVSNVTTILKYQTVMNIVSKFLIM